MSAYLMSRQIQVRCFNCLFLKCNRPEFELNRGMQSIFSIHVHPTKSTRWCDLTHRVACLDAVRPPICCKDVTVKAMASNMVILHAAEQLEVAYRCNSKQKEFGDGAEKQGDGVHRLQEQITDINSIPYCQVWGRYVHRSKGWAFIAS